MDRDSTWKMLLEGYAAQFPRRSDLCLRIKTATAVVHAMLKGPALCFSMTLTVPALLSCHRQLSDHLGEEHIGPRAVSPQKGGRFEG
jgi:hypothetical protein